MGYGSIKWCSGIVTLIIDVDSALRWLRQDSIGLSWILLVTKLIDIAGLIISISLKYPLIYHVLHNTPHLYIIGHRTTGRWNQVIQLLIQWDSGECTYEPIRDIYTGDRYMVAEYARDKGLLDEWESPSRKLKQAASRLDTLVRFSSKTSMKGIGNNNEKKHQSASSRT